MTTRNLVAAFATAVIGISLLTGANTTTQAYTKSVTPEAAVVNTEPSTKVASRIASTSRSQTRAPVKAREVKKPVQKQVAKPKAQKVGTSSAWTGRGYSPRWENVRKCIVHRESRGNYAARNRSSSAQGAYQFLDRLWRVPLSRKLNSPKLKYVPIYRWSKLHQDKAFWLVWDNGKGKSHWSLPGHQCW